MAGARRGSCQNLFALELRNRFRSDHRHTRVGHSYLPAPPLNNAVVGHEEKDRDSGNETSSLSPGMRTPLTNSPSSIPSRSNSFSVTNILRVARNNAIAQLSPVVAVSSQSDQQTPIANRQLSATDSNTTPNGVQAIETNPGSSQQLLPPILENQQAPQWMPNNLLQNPYISAGYPAMYNAAPHSMYPPRLGSGIIGPLDYYQFPPQLAFNLLPGINTRELCVICGDKASGFHYSVLSCEGCKGFFRRTIQKGITYQCHRNLQCVVDRGSRNRCQRCRFDKCISSGMNRETVRNDRARRKKQANDDNDGRLQEHKKLKDLSDQLQKAYETVWPIDCKLQNLDEFLHLVLAFMDKIPVLSQLSLDERRTIAHQRFLPLMLLRMVHLNEGHLNILTTATERRQAEERTDRYRRGLPIGLEITKNIHLISALFLTKSTTSSELSNLNNDISSALFTQLFTETNSESSFRDYLALNQHFFVLSD